MVVLGIYYDVLFLCSSLQMAVVLVVKTCSVEVMSPGKHLAWKSIKT